MATGSDHPAYRVEEAAALLPLALSDPQRAEARARELLSSRPGPDIQSFAHQCLGIVAREQGRLSDAHRELYAALQAAARAGSDARRADVMATLGVTRAAAGHPRSGLGHLERALALAPAEDRARVLMRRAYVLLGLGRPADALVDLDAALADARSRQDRLWEARCLLNRSWAHGMLGNLRAAADDAQASQVGFQELGQLREVAHALHNRSSVAFDYGDLPAALALLDEADAAYRRVDVSPPELDVLRCTVVLAARLIPEAVAEAERALGRDDLTAHQQAELLLVAASAALAAGHVETARERAEQARRLFRAQLRSRWATRAAFVVAQTTLVAEAPDERVLRSLVRLTRRLSEQRSSDAGVAMMLTARLAASVGAERVARAHLAAAAEQRGGPSPLDQATGWLAVALSCAQLADRRGVFHACRQGLDAIDRYRTTFGDLTLRALSTDHGRELSALAQQAALSTGRPRQLLAWSERTRASALASPAALPPDDLRLADAIGAARHAARELSSDGVDPMVAARARRDRDHHEAQVRRLYRALHGDSGPTPPLDMEAVVDAVGSDALVSLVDVAGVLHALLVTHGRVTRQVIGPLAHAATEAQFARFALRRAAYGRVPELATVGERLEATVLGGLGARLPERVTIIPPAALHTLPWGLLSSAADRIVGVAPSVAIWLRARGPRPPGPVTFVCGPDLSTSESEVRTESARYAAARVLVGAAATAVAAAAALDGAAVGHLAAHGSFRADAPLFSTLRVADGPLYLYDLDRLRRPPHTIVLSACDVGDSAAVGVDEGLGLVTGLLGLGVRAVLASTVPVSDLATVQVMGAVHAALADGVGLPDAWAAARRHTRNDPLAAATAASFTAWGA